MKRVAIIDDSEIVLDITRMALSEAGFEVLTMLEPTRSLLVGDRPPDLILLDVNMPQAFGDDVATFFKRRWGVTAPIYLYSSLPEEDLRRRASEAQLDGFICKNAGKEHLLARVREILGEASDGRPEMADILERFASRSLERGDRIISRLSQTGAATDDTRRIVHQELHDWTGEAKLLGLDALAVALAKMGTLLDRWRGSYGAAQHRVLGEWVRRVVDLSSEIVANPDAKPAALSALIVDLNGALAPTAGTPSEPSTTEPAESRRILVLDDSPIVRDVLAANLEGRGHVVALAANYEEFNQRLLDFDPQLVFLDVNMPDIKGDEVCRRLRQRLDVGNLPIIFLSSLPEEELSSLAQRSGASGYLTKHMGMDELLQYLDELLEQIIF